MARIVQVGFHFVYHYKDGDILVKEDWSLERVAGYIAAIEASRQLSQRYVKAATFCSRLGMTYYELVGFDKPTNYDLNRLTKKYAAMLTARAQVSPGCLGRPLATLLDELEDEIKRFIQDTEQPINMFGRLIYPDKYLTRPSEAEYTAQLEAKKAKEEEFRLRLAEQIENGVMHKKVKVNFGDYNRVCQVQKITDRYLYLDVYDDVGVCVQANMRVPKDSTRFVSRFY